MWLMLQQDKPDDYVVPPGSATVREMCAVAFAMRARDGRALVVDQANFRPAEVDMLLGDASQGETELGWEPTIARGDDPRDGRCRLRRLGVLPARIVLQSQKRSQLQRQVHA